MGELVGGGDEGGVGSGSGGHGCRKWRRQRRRKRGWGSRGVWIVTEVSVACIIRVFCATWSGRFVVSQKTQ